MAIVHGSVLNRLSCQAAGLQLILELAYVHSGGLRL